MNKFTENFVVFIDFEELNPPEARRSNEFMAIAQFQVHE